MTNDALAQKSLDALKNPEKPGLIISYTEVFWIFSWFYVKKVLRFGKVGVGVNDRK